MSLRGKFVPIPHSFSNDDIPLFVVTMGHELQFCHQVLLTHMTEFTGAINHIIKKDFQQGVHMELDYADVVCLYYLLLASREVLTDELFRDNFFSLCIGLLLLVFSVEKLELYNISSARLAKQLKLPAQSFSAFILNMSLALSEDLNDILTNKNGLYDRMLQELGMPFVPHT